MTGKSHLEDVKISSQVRKTQVLEEDGVKPLGQLGVPVHPC